MGKNVLVVIDVQTCFVNKNTKDLPKKIANIIGKTFDYVIFTKFINKKYSNFFKLLNYKKCRSSPEIDIHPALLRFTNENNVFNKTSYSIFKSKKLVTFLKKNKINTIYLCGIDIDACVLASAFEAFDRGYKVKVLESFAKSHSGEEFDKAAQKIIKKNLCK